MTIPNKTNKIQVICPICKTRDIIGIPGSRLNKTSQLTTISIHKGLICPHHFQFFIDNNFQIRGYQKVDLELDQKNSETLRNGVKAFRLTENKNKNLFKKLTLKGDTVKYSPLNSDKEMEKRNPNQKVKLKSRKMSLKEIYEEFWEFINIDNENFLEFINQDKRRKKSSMLSHKSECLIT